MTREVQKLRAANTELRIALDLARLVMRITCPAALTVYPNPNSALTLGDLITRALGREAIVPPASQVRPRRSVRGGLTPLGK